MSRQIILDFGSAGEMASQTVVGGENGLSLSFYESGKREMPGDLEKLSVLAKGYAIDVFIDSDSIVRKMDIRPSADAENVQPKPKAVIDEKARKKYKATSITESIGSFEPKKDDYEKLIERGALLAGLPVELDEKMAPGARCLAIIAALTVGEGNAVDGVPDPARSAIVAILPNWRFGQDIFYEIMYSLTRCPGELARMSTLIVDRYLQMAKREADSGTRPS